jgi:hypothetical protein
MSQANGLDQRKGNKENTMATSLENRFEEGYREAGRDARNVVTAVFEGVKKKRKEDEEYGEDWGAIAKIKANQLARRVIQNIRPQRRFRV